MSSRHPESPFGADNTHAPLLQINGHGSFSTSSATRDAEAGPRPVAITTVAPSSEDTRRRASVFALLIAGVAETSLSRSSCDLHCNRVPSRSTATSEYSIGAGVPARTPHARNYVDTACAVASVRRAAPRRRRARSLSRSLGRHCTHEC